MITKLSTYRLFSNLIKIENELNEGLILTHDIHKSIDILEQFTSINNLNYLSIENDFNKINIIGISDLNIEKLTSFLILINNLGYLVANVYLIDQNNLKHKYTLDKFKEDKYSDAVISLYKTVNLTLAAKFDITHKLKSNTMYHVTEEKYLDRILKNGLVPKSESVLSSHPERIYFTYDLEDSMQYIKVKKKYYELNPNVNYTARNIVNHKFRERHYIILEIKLDDSDKIIFYEDPDFKDKGIYTYDNISKEKITLCKTIV